MGKQQSDVALRRNVRVLRPFIVGPDAYRSGDVVTMHGHQLMTCLRAGLVEIARDDERAAVGRDDEE